MLSRRRFCSLLGGVVVGAGAVETVFADTLRPSGDLPLPTEVSGFSASKIHVLPWWTELRHRPERSRLDTIRQRLAEIRRDSETVLLAASSGVSSAFREELDRVAKDAGLRVFTRIERAETAWAALEKIDARSDEFATVAYPLQGSDNRIQIAVASPPSSQTVCGYLYARFFHKAAVSVPQAVVLFEASRCLWETYASSETPELPSRDRMLSRDCVDREYARLIDRTRTRFSTTEEPV